ncbi:MAG: hypothetical protein OQJ97_10130 [Rhodospirillales bacterium]|nr:hypothetical protein [Rhodospirillales bacterium]
MDILETLNSKKLLTPEAIEALAKYCEENESLVLASMSFFAAEIADCLGFKDAIKLIARFGGGTARFPHTISQRTQSSDIFQTIGAEQTEKFIERFGGGDMYVPSPKSVLKIIQIEEMKRRRCQGESARKISQRFDVSERTVRRHTKGLHPNAKAAE